jgi:hypothetical protein
VSVGAVARRACRLKCPPSAEKTREERCRQINGQLTRPGASSDQILALVKAQYREFNGVNAATALNRCGHHNREVAHPCSSPLCRPVD